jgi:hypothetical protein
VKRSRQEDVGFLPILAELGLPDCSWEYLQSLEHDFSLDEALEMQMSVEKPSRVAAITTRFKMKSLNAVKSAADRKAGRVNDAYSRHDASSMGFLKVRSWHVPWQ